MDIAVRPKISDRARAEKKVTGGLREVSVAQRNDEISALTQVGPNTIHATLPAVELSDRPAGFIDQSNPGTDELRVPISIQMSSATGEPLRMIAVIGVQHTDEIAVFAQVEAVGKRRMRSLIFLHDKMDPRIFDGANDIDRIIPGSIIDNDQSFRWKGLSANRTDRFGDIISVVVRWDDAGDFLAHS